MNDNATELIRQALAAVLSATGPVLVTKEQLGDDFEGMGIIMEEHEDGYVFALASAEDMKEESNDH